LNRVSSHVLQFIIDWTANVCTCVHSSSIYNLEWIGPFIIIHSYSVHGSATCVYEKKKIKKQKGICIFVWMMSVYLESMEEKSSDAMVYLNLTANERSNTVHMHRHFSLIILFNLTILYKCQNYIYICIDCLWNMRENRYQSHVYAKILVDKKKNVIISCSNLFEWEINLLSRQLLFLSLKQSRKSTVE
jgi:hypothetical protein